MKARWFILLAAAAVSGCQGHDAGYRKVQPAEVKKDERGKYVALTPEAVKRLGLAEITAGAAALIPLTALLYDARGTTSIFVREAPGRYRRETVTVASQNAAAFTAKEPLAGRVIITVGAAELNGTEEGVGK